MPDALSGRVITQSLFITWVLVAWLQQRSLGPALFAMPPRHRWVAWIFFLCLLTGRSSIHPEGIISRSTVVRWDKLAGWVWEGSSQELLLWVPFSTVYLLPLRQSVCHHSRETKTEELEDLLQRFAPERYRPFSADQPPERTSHG